MENIIHTLGDISENIIRFIFYIVMFFYGLYFLILFILWLPVTQNFVKSSINTALQDSGYYIEIENLTINRKLEVVVDSFTLFGNNETLISISDATFASSLFSIFVGKITTDINISQLKLFDAEYPKLEYEQPKEQSPPSNINSYLKSYLPRFITRIEIDSLKYIDDNNENTFDIYTKLMLDTKRYGSTLFNSLNIDLADNSTGEYSDILNAKIMLQANYNDLSGKLDIINYNITSPIVKSQGVGLINFKSKEIQQFNNSLQLNYEDYTATGFLSIDGKFEDIDLELIAQIKQLDNAQITPLRVEANLVGRVLNTKFYTEYKDLPIDLSADTYFADDHLIINNFSSSLRRSQSDGKIIYDYESAIFNGFYSINIPSLAPIARRTKVAIRGSGDSVIKFSSDDLKGQQINASINLKDFSYNDLIIDNLVFDAQIFTDNIEKSTAKLESQNIQYSNNVTDYFNINIEQENNTVIINSTAQAYIDNPVNFNAKIVYTPNEKRLDFEQFLLASEDGKSEIIGYYTTENIDIAFTAQKLPLKLLPIAITDKFGNTRMDWDLSIKGDAQKPIINFVHKYYGRDNLNNFSLDSALSYKDKKLRYLLSSTGVYSENLKGEIYLPLEFSIYPYKYKLIKDGSGYAILSGKIGSQFANDHILNQNQFITGDISLDFNFSKDTDYKIDAIIGLNELNYNNSQIGIDLRSINGNLSLQDRIFTIDNINAISHADSVVKIDGKLPFLDSENLYFNIVADKGLILKNDLYELSARANLTLKQENNNTILSGDANIDRFEFIIPSSFEQSFDQLNIVDTYSYYGLQSQEADMRNKLMLDINVKARDSIFIKGWGLNVELAGNVNVNNTILDPEFFGQLDLVRGVYSEFGRIFEFDEARLNFAGQIPPSPYLSLSSITQTDDAQIEISVKGNISDPDVEFTSTPSLPEDEIFSQLLFGASVENISPFQAVQLANTVARFSSGGSGLLGNPLSNIQNTLGISRINVDTDEEGEYTVGVGKFLTDKVYLEYEQGPDEQSSGVKVEVNVAPKLKIESKAKQSGDSGMGAYYQWRY